MINQTLQIYLSIKFFVMYLYIAHHEQLQTLFLNQGLCLQYD